MRSLFLVLAAVAPLLAEEPALEIEVGQEPIVEGKNVDILYTLKVGKEPFVLKSLEDFVDGHWRGAGGSTETIHGFWLSPGFEGAMTVSLVSYDEDAYRASEGKKGHLSLWFGDNEFLMCKTTPPRGKSPWRVGSTNLLAAVPHELRVRAAGWTVKALQCDPSHPLLLARQKEDATYSLPPAEGLSYTPPPNIDLGFRYWSPPGLTETPTGGVLVASSVANRAVEFVVDKSIPLTVTPASYPSAEAAKKAGISLTATSRGYFLPKIETWVFYTDKGDVIVPREGEPRTTRWACVQEDLADKGEAWFNTKPGSEEEKLLEEVGLPRSKMFHDRFLCHEEDFLGLIDAFERHEVICTQCDGLRKFADLPHWLPEDTRPKRKIPCLECKILHPGTKDCHDCHSTGEVEVDYGDLDEKARRTLALRDRKTLANLMESAREVPQDDADNAWGAVEREARLALVNSLYCGASYEAAWIGRDAAPLDPTLRSALDDRVRAELREVILDALARRGRR